MEKCRQKPSAAEPLEIRCTACGGAGCDECRDTGAIEITSCPLTIVPADVWRVLEFAELFRKGLPPIAGGVLEQSATFVAACRQIWADQDVYEAEDEARRR